jgi:hypothetical protein
LLLLEKGMFYNPMHFEDKPGAKQLKCLEL